MKRALVLAGFCFLAWAVLSNARAVEPKKYCFISPGENGHMYCTENWYEALAQRHIWCRLPYCAEWDFGGKE